MATTKKKTSTRTRSAKSGKFVEKKKATTSPSTTVSETVKAKPKTGKTDFEFPEVLGNDYHPYQLRLRIYAKQLEDAIQIKGVKGKPGDYVFKASDGGVGILTEAELNEHYQPAPPSPAA